MTESREASIEGLCVKSREAILTVTDAVLALMPPGADFKSVDNSKVERLFNRLAWHLGFWKSYGTSDTAKRAQAGLKQIASLTALAHSTGGWETPRQLMVYTFQSINGMALEPDRRRINPLLIRELYTQIEADLKAFKVEFGASARR